MNNDLCNLAFACMCSPPCNCVRQAVDLVSNCQSCNEQSKQLLRKSHDERETQSQS